MARMRLSGFTLLELSIVLALIGVILSGGLLTFSAYMQSSQYNTTVARMDAIEQALLNFASVYSRIPCPANLSTPTTNLNYGIEPGSGFPSSATPPGTGKCTGSISPQSSYISTGGQVEGAVPTRALQLPDSYMYDGWGHRFRYAVDLTATITGILPMRAGAGWCGNGITINDSTGAARSTNALYALISHGANGHGAISADGVAHNAGSANTAELANCHCDSSAVNGTYTGTYVQQMITLDSTSAYNSYDDIVTYKEAWQMQSQNMPLASTAPTASTSSMCIYVADNVNAWVAQYKSDGTYLSQIGSASAAPAPAGQFVAPNPVRLDSYGVLWIGDFSYNKLNQFSQSGTYINRFGAQGSTGLGKTQNLGGVAVDTYGNIWVADSGGSRVEMMSASTQTFVGQVGCDGTDPCTAGTGNGQLGTNVKAIVFDASNHLWVIDGSNYRVEEFSINYNNVTGGSGGNINMGTFVQTVGGGASCTGCASTSSCTCTSGTGVGMFALPTDVATDPDGSDIWVVDSNNHRIEKFTISGATSTFAQMLGGQGGSCPSAASCAASSGSCSTACSSTASCYCSSGNGNGQLNHPYGMAFDPSGKIWVTEVTNKRVQEFDPASGGINGAGSFMDGGTGVTGYVTKFGSSGSSAGQFTTPEGIAISR